MELTKTVIFFAGVLLAVCSGLPAHIKDEVERVTPVKTYGNQPIVDTGVFSGWESPFSSNPFEGIFGNLEGIMERMHQKIAALLNRFPVGHGGNSTEDLSPFPGVLAPTFPGISGIDLAKGNTTSITKVIDGHTVVINETEYKKEDDFGGTFFKVRIIDVKPDESDLTTEKEAEAVPESSTPKDREEIANSIENEIFKSKEAEVLDTSKVSFYDNLPTSGNSRFQNIESFDDLSPIDYQHPIEPLQNRFSTNTEWSDEDLVSNTAIPEWSHVDPVESFDTNSIENGRQIPIDLSRDTYVNEMLARNGAPTNPDAEVFEVEDFRNRGHFERFIDPR